MKVTITAINADYTTHRTTYQVSSVSEAYQLWFNDFGHTPFIGNLVFTTDQQASEVF